MAWEYGDFFRVLEIRAEPSDREELRRHLGLSPEALAEPSAERLFDLIERACEAVVVEKDYIDLDFRKGFGRFHHLRHFDTSRRCKRLHLFACPIRSRDLLRLPRRVQAQYLGFVVVRPLPSHMIGRSVLSERLVPTVPGLGSGYLTCKTKFPVNLAGNDLEIEGTPYMEQDTLVSACASVSLWIVSWYMAHRYAPEFKVFCTPEITDMATRYSVPTGRAMPSGGLTLEQMMNALREMGFDPLPYELRSSEAAVRAVYRYVESEIPVIASLWFRRRGGHAVAIVGHTFDPSHQPTLREWPMAEGEPLTYCSSSQFVPAFIVQDDAGGPFRFMELTDWGDYIMAVFDRGTKYEEAAVFRAALVPVPQGVTLDGFHAEQVSLFLFSNFLARVGARAPKEVVLRTFLQLSNEVKRRLDSQLSRSRSARRLLRQHLLSKWVWVTEISDIGSLRTDRVGVGQVIQDCAGHPSLNYLDLLAAYFPYHLYLMNPQGEGKVLPILDYVPYPLFTRPHA